VNFLLDPGDNPRPTDKWDTIERFLTHAKRG